MPSTELDFTPARRSAALGPRVLMTADAVGGVWEYALDLASEVSARGGAVTLAVMGPSPTGVQRESAYALGVDLECAPFRLEWMESPWQDVDAAGEWLLRLERVIEPDVVHLNGFCHATLPWRSPAIVVAHSCVCSWWRAVHGEAAPTAWQEYRARVARGLRSARLIVAPTHAMRRALDAEYGSIAGSVRVIANGRSCVACNPATPSVKAPYVLSAGRLWDPAKNIEALCSAAAFVSWPVYVAGDTDGIGNRPVALGHVRWLGRLPPDDLQHWMRGAAIYALPARYEPFGLSVLEAAAAGCALVLGDIDSLRETWNGCAVFVPPDDPAALRDALDTLIRADDERTRLGVLARAAARAFTVTRMTDAYVEAYGEIAGGRWKLAS